MLEILFGWGKASKCKALIKTVRSRMKLVRKKRDIQVKHLRSDVAELLRNGQDRNTFSRIELLFKEQNLLAGYDMVEHFCKCILKRLSYIRRHKDRPQDINESVSSLIFAAARCADLPELQCLRRLFVKRYGHQFETAAVELFPDCGVNQQIIDKFCPRSPSSAAKLKLMKEIAEEFNLQWDSSNVEAELCKPAKDSLTRSKGSQNYQLCQHGTGSSPHLASSLTNYIDGTSLHTANYGGRSVNDKFSNAVEKKEGGFSNERNETLPRYFGCEEEIFDRDISVVSSSVKETLATSANIGRTLHVEKQNSLPSAIDLRSRRSNFGLRSNGHKFLRSNCDSGALVNDDLEDRVYHVDPATASGVTVKSVEQAAGAAWLGANLKESPKLLVEGNAFDCPFDNSAENEEDASDPKCIHQPEDKPAKTKHSRWMSNPEDRYCSMQFSNGLLNTCIPEVNEKLLERDSDFKSSAHLKSMKAYKSLSMPIASGLDVERQEPENFSMEQEKCNRQADYNIMRRGSFRTDNGLGKFGMNGRKDGRHKSCNKIPRQRHFDSHDFIDVDGHVGWKVGHRECDFEDSIEAGEFRRFDGHVAAVNVTATQEHASGLQNISRSRKARSDSSKRISPSSYYHDEMNNHCCAAYEECSSRIFPEANSTDHFVTVSSIKKDIARRPHYDHSGESQVVFPLRKRSVHNPDNQELPWQCSEDRLRLSSRNSDQMSYDMFDGYIDSDSVDGTSFSGKNFYSASDWPSPIHARLHCRKSATRQNKGNGQIPFEEASNDTKKMYDRCNSNSEKQRSYKMVDDFGQPQHEEVHLETYNVHEQMFCPNERSDGGSHSVEWLLSELPQCSGKGTKLVPQSFRVNYRECSFKNRLHGPDHPSNRYLHHIGNYGSVLEEQHMQQPDNTGQYSKTALVRNSKSKERLYKGQQSYGNKPQKGRTESQDLAHKHPYHVDMDGLDLEDEHAQQSKSIEKFRKGTHAAHAGSVRRHYDGQKTCENRSNNGSSKLLECSVELKFRGNKCDGWPAERMEKVYTPRVSVTCMDEGRKAQQQHSSLNDREGNQLLCGRHGIPEPECPPAKGKLHDNAAKLKHRNASFDLAKDEEMQHSLDGTDDFQDAKVFMRRNSQNTPDWVASLHQFVGGEPMSVTELSKSMMHESSKFVKKSSGASSNVSSCIGFHPPASTPPLVSSPSHSSVSLEFPSLAKPHNLSSCARPPPQRTPAILPCTWQRAISLPIEHLRSSPLRSSVRSNSLQPNLFKENSSNVVSPHIPHVHPKLPDYDDLAAQFAALKQQHRASNSSE